ARNNYVDFCSGVLSTYFGALKAVYKDEWGLKDSKILSVICINGFIIALTNQLQINGIKDYEFYKNSFQKLEYNFSAKDFPYTSSQYKKFSIEILKHAFSISSE
ncbi:MAG: hypothetical protein RR585_11580, partial [Coprobacillus sp.]